MNLWLLFIMTLIVTLIITFMFIIIKKHTERLLDDDGVEYYYWNGRKCRKYREIIVDHMPDEKDMKSGILYMQIVPHNPDAIPFVDIDEIL